MQKIILVGQKINKVTGKVENIKIELAEAMKLDFIKEMLDAHKHDGINFETEYDDTQKTRAIIAWANSDNNTEYFFEKDFEVNDNEESKLNKMTLEEFFKNVSEYRITLATKNGVEGIGFYGVNKKEEEYIIKNKERIMEIKPKIMQYLKEQREKIRKKNEDYLAKKEKEEQYLIDSGKAKLMLVGTKIMWAIEIEETAYRKAHIQPFKTYHEVKHFLYAEIEEMCLESTDIKNMKYVYEAEIGYYLTKEDVEKIVQADKEIELRKLEEERLEKENEEKEIQAIFAKAKETGVKQVLYRGMVPCNDKKEECSCDVITVFAMPDGTEKKERQHTW